MLMHKFKKSWEDKTVFNFVHARKKAYALKYESPHVVKASWRQNKGKVHLYFAGQNERTILCPYTYMVFNHAKHLFSPNQEAVVIITPCTVFSIKMYLHEQTLQNRLEKTEKTWALQAVLRSQRSICMLHVKVTVMKAENTLNLKVLSL